MLNSYNTKENRPEETNGDEKHPTKGKDTNSFIMTIPECCREGWKNCPHVPKKQRPIKRNIGL